MKRVVGLVVLNVLLMSGLLASQARAETQKFNRKDFEELVDVSSTETIPAGTKITLQNWQQYRRFMPVFLQYLFSGKNRFHVGQGPEYTAAVVPTEDYPMPKAMRDDTEKYAGQTTLEPYPPTGGFTFKGYKAGTPFPNPQEPNRAAKILFNAWVGYYQPFVLHEFSKNWQTDSFGNVTPVETDDSFYRLMHMSDPPYPMHMPDADGNVQANRFWTMVPEQARYTTALELISADPAKLTEEYVFLPSLRRSLRLSTASRCTPILGTDYLADDTDWKPAYFKPEFYGEKKILVPFADPKTAYTEQSRLNYVGGDYKSGVALPGWPKPEHNFWQVRKFYVLNVKPVAALGNGYCYSERIFYIDQQIAYPFIIENYDRGGKLYHVNWVIIAPIQYKGERTVMPRSFAFSAAYDLQNVHASPDIGYDLTIDETVPGEYKAAGIYTPGGLARVMK